MVADRQECVRCGRGAEWNEAVCVACGTTLLVHVTLLVQPADPRVRYELARELTSLKLALNVEPAAELKKPRPQLAHGVTREVAATVARTLAAHQLELEITPAALGAPAPSGRGVPRWPLAALGLVIVAVGGWFVQRKKDVPPAVGAPVATVAPAPVASGTSVSDAMRSVVSVRCKTSLGSGFFVAPRKVLTNHHVLCSDGTPPRVVTSDGQEAQSLVMGDDQQHDLALLEVALDAPALPLADAAAAELGGSVSIMGSPKGLEFSVQRGSIAFVGRVLRGVSYLQLDSAVNPGNSGGPVLDANGRVIAVVTARVNNADGIGFAVPINYALDKVWNEGPEALNSEAWKAQAAKAQAAPVAGDEGAKATGPRMPTDYKFLLARAQWFASYRDSQPSIDAVVVTPDVDATQRRWRFRLMKGDEAKCDLFSVKTVAWIRLESTDPNLDPAFAKQLVEQQLDRKLYVGVLRLQWSACPGIYMNQARELAIDLPGAPEGFDRVGILGGAY
jgi:S1-C subfamily serine protease